MNASMNLIGLGEMSAECKSQFLKRQAEDLSQKCQVAFENLASCIKLWADVIRSASAKAASLIFKLLPEGR